ncbi:hypothetical protein Efla_004680 [Eimeria flavescens]
MVSIEPVAVVTRWVGFLSSTSPSISIGNDPLADVNKASWRMQLFSFVPTVFVDPHLRCLHERVGELEARQGQQKKKQIKN